MSGSIGAPGTAGVNGAIGGGLASTGTGGGDGGDGSQYQSEPITDDGSGFNITFGARGGSGGDGGAGGEGAIGETEELLTYLPGLNQTEQIDTSAAGGPGGFGGSGGAGGAATSEYQTATILVDNSADAGDFLYVTTTGGNGGSGGAGGTGGSSGNEITDVVSPNYVAYNNSNGGGFGGGAGMGGSGGAATSVVTADTVLQNSQGGEDSLAVGVYAYGGSGGAGGAGGAGGTGILPGNGNVGADGGAGGAATAAVGAVAIDLPSGFVEIDAEATGGTGGTGGSYGDAGSGQFGTIDQVTGYNSILTTYGYNGPTGGFGGNGGDATASVAGNTISARAVEVYLSTIVGPGGAGGENSTPADPYAQPGTAGVGTISFTGNEITLQPIPNSVDYSEAQISSSSELQIYLEPYGGLTPIPAGAIGATVDFTGNTFIGVGESTLNLQLSESPITIDTQAGSIGTSGSSLSNSITGFTNFILGEDNTFVVGPGSYTVRLAADPDTLVYTPTSGDVTLSGATDSNLVLDFEGFGSSLNATELLDDTTSSGGNTFISIPGAGMINLAGFGGPIPAADENFDTSATVPCFLKGTNIATERGPVPVEALRQSDRILTSSGGVRPITWIGKRTLDPSRHPEPKAILPIRIRCGTFGKGRPTRDLFLSPDHAIFIDGMLVPIKYMVNGDSICQIGEFSIVSYFHVELDRHDVLLADGLPAESYLDTGDRIKFRAGGVEKLIDPYLAERVREAEAFAPFVVTGPPLEAINARLLLQAEMLSAGKGKQGIPLGIALACLKCCSGTPAR